MEGWQNIRRRQLRCPGFNACERIELKPRLSLVLRNPRIQSGKPKATTLGDREQKYPGVSVTEEEEVVNIAFGEYSRRERANTTTVVLCGSVQYFVVWCFVIR